MMLSLFKYDDSNDPQLVLLYSKHNQKIKDLSKIKYKLDINLYLDHFLLAGAYPIPHISN